jgi:hypothetical protein
MPKFFGSNDSAEMQDQIRKQSETITSLVSIQKALLDLVKAALLKQIDINGPANKALRQTLAVAEEGLKALTPQAGPAVSPAPAPKAADNEEEFILDSPPKVAPKPVSPPPPKPAAPVPPAPQKPGAIAPSHPLQQPAAKPQPPSARPAASDDDEFDLESLVGKK